MHLSKPNGFPGHPRLSLSLSKTAYIFREKRPAALRLKLSTTMYGLTSCLFPTPGWNIRCKIYICSPQAPPKQPRPTERFRGALTWPKEQPMNNGEATRTSSFHILGENKITSTSTVGCCSAAPKQQQPQRRNLWKSQGTYKLNL